jgi:glycosyltransferase involved in cell wall biosynthesis
MSDELDRPPIAKAALSIVLPAHNVESRLDKIIEAWTEYLDSLKRDYEILLVDDGSTDGTAAAAKTIAGKRSRLKLLSHAERQGFGAALRTGLAAAQYPLVCYSSCDPAYQPRQLGRLLDKIDQADLVAGFRAGRALPGPFRVAGILWWWLVRIVFGIHLDPWPGWLGGKAYAYHKLIRLIFGVRLRDVDCPFKLFRRSIFTRIPIQSDGEFVHAEILAKANFLGCIMDEASLEAPAQWIVDPKRTAQLGRVFAAPDFGPALLPEPAKATP